MTKKEIIEAQTLCNTWLKDLTPDEINHIEDMMEEYATSLADEMKADLTALLREEASIEFAEWAGSNGWRLISEGIWHNISDLIHVASFKTTSELYNSKEYQEYRKNKQ